MKNYKKKTIAPIVVTILMIMYYVVYFGFLISLLEGVIKYALGINAGSCGSYRIWYSS